MAKKILAIDDTTTLVSYPFEATGGLVERLTSAEVITELGISAGGITILDEGVAETGPLDSGTFDTIDFVGAGVSVSVVADVATVSIPGGAGEAFPVGAVYINVTGVNPGTELGYGTWSAFGAGRVMVGYDSGDTDFDTVEETGGAKTKAISAHSGTAVADHASHTHTYTEVPNHTHPVNITDPGHTHVYTSQTATTGSVSSYEHGAIDASSTAAEASISVNSATTGITATTSNPSAGVATGTTSGPSATLSHSVTQPSDHSDLNVVQPYIVAHFWKRTA